MNDLKRDLTALFHEKADSVETPPVVPPDVLRRGRRRQSATVLGTAGGLIAAGLVIFVVVQAPRAPTTERFGAPSVTPTATPGIGVWKGGGELPTVVVGGATKATFDAFGASWTITDDANGVTLERTFGGDTSFHELYNGQGTQVDAAGGTFLLEQTDSSVDHVSATVDGDGTVEGAWMQTFRDAGGRPGRIWVVPLPGSGTGTARVGDAAPSAMSWPSSGGALKPAMS